MNDAMTDSWKNTVSKHTLEGRQSRIPSKCIISNSFTSQHSFPSEIFTQWVKLNDGKKDNQPWKVRLIKELIILI
jgi:hypothetical protein